MSVLDGMDGMQELEGDPGGHLRGLLGAETEIDINAFTLSAIEQFGGLDALAQELKIQYDHTPAGSPGRAAILNNMIKLILTLSETDKADDDDLEKLEAQYKAIHGELGPKSAS